MQALTDDNPLSGFDTGLRRAITEQAKVCRMNVDRTLATWTRSGLSLLIFGVIVDRYGVLLAPRVHPGTMLAPDPLFAVGGIALILMGTLMALVVAIRHQAYRRHWNHVYAEFGALGPWLAFVYAAGVVATGCVLMLVLLWFRR